jgi:hypothetical protein
MAITSGNTANLKTWTGSGRLAAVQALLWDIRLFGIFSPMLNSVIPGAGYNRAYQAGMDFIVTNGMVATGNLEVRSTEFRLLYSGTLNLQQQLDARVEANILRDVPLFGRFLGLAFSPLSKLFEYKVNGTLADPAYHPVLIPKSLSNLLEPFRKKTVAPPETPLAPP